MHLDRLSSLNHHLDYLHTKIPDTPLYLVGGCVRDLLLGRTDFPTDIDVTAPGEPETIRGRIGYQERESDFSFFYTEKFGTMTIVPKTDNISNTQYELTPLRTEWWYVDKRHPDEIHRSSDLVLDSQRRDFTINAMYYTSVTFSQIKDGTDKKTKNREELETTNSKLATLTKQLEKQGITYDADNYLIIIQSPELISQSFPDWIPDLTYLFALVKSLSPEVQPRQVGILIDPAKWRYDVINQKIRCVGNADNRINEDALRIIRALRFGIQLKGFDYSKQTRLALQKRYFQIQHVAKERVLQEIIKVFQADNFFGFVAMCDEINILQYLFSAVTRIKQQEQPIRYHPFDTYTHTLLVLYELEKTNHNPLLKLAALYHDVGKREQYDMQRIKMSIDDSRKMYGSRINHTICGADHTRHDMQQLWLSRKQIDEITRYVAMHMKPGEILMSRPDKRKHKLRLLLSEAWYDRVRNLLDLTLADRRGQYNPLQSSDESGVYRLIELLDELHDAEGQFTLRDLAINGNDAMEALCVPAWPEIKILLDKAMQWVLENISERNDKKKILSYLKKSL